MEYFLAIDIGASSGRHILGYKNNNKIELEEIHRFKNQAHLKNDNLCWDLNYLFQEIKEGLKKCKSLGKIPTSLGIDTWGVDFVLLDKNKNILGDSISYRDKRTNGIMENIVNDLGQHHIYQKTGIQFMEFNSLYQLSTIDSSIKSKAKHFLMIPDYLNYLLTGKITNEYTNATTTQLFNFEENDWDEKILNYLGVDKNIFSKPELPKHSLGLFDDNIFEEIGFQCEVVLSPSHDTASAFISSFLDMDDKGVILSSGTWSLLGKEIKEPIVSKKALELNFTNEGGVDTRYRFLKNIMGLWIIQEVSKNLDYKYTFEELMKFAEESNHFKSIIDVNDQRFFSPTNMIDEIVAYCYETNQQVPKTVGEISICVYRSLAKSYKKYVNELSEIIDEEILKINIIGGGCKNTLLNKLIMEETGKEVIVGPVEATALGNILTQMIASNHIKDIKGAKQIIKNSF